MAAIIVTDPYHVVWGVSPSVIRLLGVLKTARDSHVRWEELQL